MKTIIISAVIALYACMNQADKSSVDHIVLPPVDTKEQLSPDTFIPISNEELIVTEEPELISDTKSTVHQNQKENLTTKNETATKEKTTDEIVVKGENLQEDEIIVQNDDNVELEGTVKSTTTNSTPIKDEKVVIQDRPIQNNEIVNEVVETAQEDAVQEEVIIDNQNTEKEIAAELPIKADHSIFAELLSSYVTNNGDVNYKGLKASEAKLDSYLSELDKNSPQADWSKNERLAYWMNAYNAFTIKLILDNYPVSKITDLHGGKPWDLKWITLGSKSYSLNNIEHDIIRPTFNDPRIHFAVNCAAKSCPPLLNKAYTGDNVNRLLNNVTKAFVNSNSNQISGNSVQLSKIFEWYAVDFGNIIDFLNQYSAKKIDSSAKIGYLDYNWSLNEG